jgi:hypothetical protein
MPDAILFVLDSYVMDVARTFRWVFSPELGFRNRLFPRWLFLRALGVIYLSAFYSLIFQIKGLIGPRGILRANHYLAEIAAAIGPLRYWYAPTVFWISSNSPMLLTICWAGIIASLLLIFNVWPRLMLVICFVCFLSFISAASDFSSYQSDGMLLEAGFISIFLAPEGMRPGLGVDSPPSRISYFLLMWEWFRIYFESGVVKLLSGDVHWRNWTAMDEYYQNGPLPTWVGWYLQHLPHWFHATTVVLTLSLELGVIWLAVLPRRWRLLCFLIVTPWEVVVILTANYAFLNYLVLALGLLLLDDGYFVTWLPSRFWHSIQRGTTSRDESAPDSAHTARAPKHKPPSFACTHLKRIWLGVSAVMLTWILYASSLLLVRMLWRSVPLPITPIVALEPFRIANQYGLFAVMTPARYEIEFQGSNDGQSWSAYGFLYKPQALSQPPGIYAPYQPRFDWNLWFASLGDWQQYPIVLRTEECLLDNDADVLALFDGNPFQTGAPKMVRAVLWQYWFTSLSEKRQKGLWWRRVLMGTYAPTIEKLPNGRFAATQMPTASGSPQ